MADFELKICFGKSKSKNYERAMELARNFNSFKEGDPNTITIGQAQIVRDCGKIYQLLFYIDKWTSTRIYFNGQEITSLRQFQNRLMGISCHAGYHNAVIQEIYCWQNKEMPGWGCKRLEAVVRHYCPGITLWQDDMMYWFEIGQFVANELWRIDKKEIVRLLKREAELKYLNLCPIFDFDRVTAAVDELPDNIDLSNTDQWEIEYIEEIGCEPRAVKVRPKKLI